MILYLSRWCFDVMKWLPLRSLTRCVVSMSLSLLCLPNEIRVYLRYKRDAPEQIMTLLIAHQTQAAANQGEFIFLKKKKKMWKKHATIRTILHEIWHWPIIIPTRSIVYVQGVFDRVHCVAERKVYEKFETKNHSNNIKWNCWSTAIPYTHPPTYTWSKRCLCVWKALKIDNVEWKREW